MIVDGNDVQVGDKIKFRTINTYDTNVWSGDVVGFCNYTMAKAYTDVVAYHTNVLKDNDIPDPVTELDYMIVKTIEGAFRAFAIEWVQPTTLVIVDTTSNVTIKVFNVPSEEQTTILTLLRDNNYKCSIVG